MFEGRIGLYSHVRNTVRDQAYKLRASPAPIRSIHYPYCLLLSTILYCQGSSDCLYKFEN